MITLLDILISNLKASPDHASFWVKRKRTFKPITNSQMAESIVSFSLGLKSLGLKAKHHVAIVSNNRPEWVITDFAVIGLGACLVPVYPTLSAADMAFILNDSEATMVVAETKDHLDQILSIKKDCPKLTHIIFMGEALEDREKGITLFSEVTAVGDVCTPEERQAIRKGWAKIEPDHLATIVYTSGTTSKPKGVCLTHQNIMTNVADILQVLPITSSDVVLSFLPLSHVFERTAGYYTVLAAGGTIYYAESIHSVSDDMRLAHPTVVVSVPRLYEKVQATMLATATGVKGVILRLALRVGRAYRMTSHPGMALKLAHQMMNRLVYSKLRYKLGGRLRFFVSGGAPLRKDLAEFFCDLGVVIIEGYGMTETSPVLTCNRLDHYQFGSVGLALPSVELKLGAQDELLAKGPSITSGYWKRPDATAELLDGNGWLHTGDVAKIDKAGFVTIVDRIKELIVLSNGKKVPPQVIESQIKTSRLVAQVMVIGDKRSYLTALVVPNVDELKKHHCGAGWDGKNLAEFLNRKKVIFCVESEVIKALSAFSGYEKVKKCGLLAQEWSIETGELTPSLKVKRKVVLEKYADVIDGMYV